MEKLQHLAQQHHVTFFLLLTLILSGFAFFLMWLVPKWQTPENIEALPVWVLAVWSPTISAIAVWALQGLLLSKLKILFSLPGLSPWFVVILIPLIIMLIILQFHQTTLSFSELRLSIGTIILLLVFNLALGPLGEEAGWRGLFFPTLQSEYGWLGAAIIVGIIWTLWHAPLWGINSPQSEIGFLIFTGHVFCYSILMAIIYMESNGSIIPVIIFHLLVNFITGYISIIGTHSVADIYRISLSYYAIATVITVLIYEFTREKECQIIQV